MTTWDRIDAELAKRHRNWQWLADEMGTTIQRLHNWKSRGVPPDSWLEIATVLHLSLDYLAGLSTDNRYFAHEQAASYTSWPLRRVSAAQFHALPPDLQDGVDRYVEGVVDAWSKSHASKTKTR